ncbi:MAG: type III-A CRISPR-associated RAMP protein Csm5 [Methanocalculus sp.]|uniref:type III-A CRISPR-associated RAMP protein Csm5 n=1 Tax=Methanocalculus sp. TaxID=2004547 RepID=UPI00271FE648|nr:type III-A CRISPR-associated RAMP protein Csm5 [Methanocalculus sp.]MDO9539323.1 type III-A CRISPR-associated RAMP protein Csm5 [Methanocalculus sp.]
MKLELRTITPVHIGTGEKFGGAEIFSTKGGFFRTSISDIVRGLEGRAYEELLSDLEEPGFQLSAFLKRHPEVKPKERYFLKSAVVTSPVEVRECIKTGFDLPYIPGSSLKGAIRSALIWQACKNDLKFPPDSLRQSRPNKKWVGSDLFNEMMNLRRNKYDPKYDLLRFLEVSDFMPLKPFLYLEELKTYSLKNRGMEEKPYGITCETLFARLEGTISLSPEIAHAINHRDYPLLKEKLNLLGITASDLSGINDPVTLATVEAKVIEHLKKVMRAFLSSALSHDALLCSAGGVKELSNEITSMQEKHKTEDLLRLGFSIGTTYQTVMALIEERDAELAADLITHMRLGKYPRESGEKSVSPPYPKSIEFIITDKGPLMPGWIAW